MSTPLRSLITLASSRCAATVGSASCHRVLQAGRGRFASRLAAGAAWRPFPLFSIRLSYRRKAHQVSGFPSRLFPINCVASWRSYAAAADNVEEVDKKKSEDVDNYIEDAVKDVAGSYVLPPEAWAAPGAWVDLEFERAGLNPESSDSSLPSPWGSWKEGLRHPDSNVLWPHPTLNEHRSRPFALPLEAGVGIDVGSQNGDPRVKPARKEPNDPLIQLERNRDRLVALWRMSRSHGISWDELDYAYVRFAKAGKQRYDEWARQGPAGIKAVNEKELARKRVLRHLQRFTKPGEDAALLYPSRLRRLTSRTYRQVKRDWLAPFRPGRLSEHLQQLVAARMLRRETSERALGFYSTVRRDV